MRLVRDAGLEAVRCDVLYSGGRRCVLHVASAAGLAKAQLVAIRIHKGREGPAGLGGGRAEEPDAALGQQPVFRREGRAVDNQAAQ